MKIRESGMPEQRLWETFFDPTKVLNTLGLNAEVNDVAEFGCGYGTFTIPSAEMVRGTVYTFDIDPEMIRMTREAAEQQGLQNVEAQLRDFVAEGTGLKSKSVDFSMLFNILHFENPLQLLKEAHRILRDEGRIGIIHWNHDPKTPRGPSMEIRPKPGQCIQWATSVGFTCPILYDLKPYHYGIVLRKELGR